MKELIEFISRSEENSNHTVCKSCFKNRKGEGSCCYLLQHVFLEVFRVDIQCLGSNFNAK